MLSIHRWIGTASLAIACAGCATWSKPGATQDDFNRESAGCTASAYSQFPPAMRTVRPAVTGVQMPGQSQTDCDVNGNHASCTTTGTGTMTLPVFIPGQDVDDNASARQAAWQSCMYSSGWSYGNSSTSLNQPTTHLPPSAHALPLNQDTFDKSAEPKRRFDGYLCKDADLKPPVTKGCESTTSPGQVPVNISTEPKRRFDGYLCKDADLKPPVTKGCE